MRKLAVRHRGQGLVQTLGLLFVTLMVGAFAVDAGMYFTFQNGMQNAADAAALAAASELFKAPVTSLGTRLDRARDAAQEVAVLNMGKKLDPSSDIGFGFYNAKDNSYTDMPYTQSADSKVFASTGGYNAVQVVVRAGRNRANKAIPSFFARFLGVKSLTSQADAIAVYAGGVESANHVRPIFLCQAAWDEAAKRYGDPTVPQITLYGNLGGNGSVGDTGDGASQFGRSSRIRIGSESLDTSTLCPPLGEGNWGLVDFSNSNGEVAPPTVMEWFRTGYTQAVSVGSDYEPMPGSKSNSYSSALDNLISNNTIIPVPLYETTTDNGMKLTVSSIVGFQIEGKSTTGSSPYIRGHFVKVICHSDCTLPPVPTTSGGMSKIRLVR